MSLTGRAGHRARAFYSQRAAPTRRRCRATAADQPCGTGDSSSRRPADAAITPRATRSQLHSSRARAGSAAPVRSRSAVVERKPAVEPLGDRRARRRRRAGTSEQARVRCRQRVGERRARPRAAPSGRRRPAARRAAAASAATMPNASGKVLGKTSASAAGSSRADLVVLEPAGERDAAGGGAGRLGVGLRAARRGTSRAFAAGPAGRPRARGPRAAISRARGEVARVERGEQALGRVAGTRRSRREQARARVGARRRAARRRAAGRCPWSTISLPTKTTRGPSASANHSSAAAAPRAVAPERRRRPARADPPASARSLARRLGARSAARRARVSTPGGPSRVLAGSSGSSSVSHRLSAVWREPTRTPRTRAAIPSRA